MYIAIKNLRFKLKSKKNHTKITNFKCEFCPLVHMHLKCVLFYEFLRNEIESQIFWQCISIDALWMCVVSKILETPKYVYLNGF